MSNTLLSPINTFILIQQTEKKTWLNTCLANSFDSLQRHVSQHFGLDASQKHVILHFVYLFFLKTVMQRLRNINIQHVSTSASIRQYKEESLFPQFRGVDVE